VAPLPSGRRIVSTASREFRQGRDAYGRAGTSEVPDQMGNRAEERACRETVSMISPRGIALRLRTQNGKRVPDFTRDGTPVYGVRVWDPVLKRRVERTAEGLDAAKRLLAEFGEAKRRPGRLQADHAVSRLRVYDGQELKAAEGGDAVARNAVFHGLSPRTVGSTV